VGIELFGDALGDGAGGDAAGLGVADESGDAAAELEADLGELGGLAGAGLAAEDDDLVFGDGFLDVLALFDDGEVLGVGGLGEGLLAGVASADGAVDVGGKLLEGVGEVAVVLGGALETAEAAAEGVAVAQDGVVDLGGEVAEVGVGHW